MKALKHEEAWCVKAAKKKRKQRDFLVVQGIHLQGMQVQPLFWEDPTCYRITKPICHNSGA